MTAILYVGWHCGCAIALTVGVPDQATHSVTTIAKTAVELAIISRFDIKVKLGKENFEPLHKSLTVRPTEKELHALCRAQARWQIYQARVIKDFRGDAVSCPKLVTVAHFTLIVLGPSD